MEATDAARAVGNGQKIDAGRWASIVSDVLARQPELAAVTVQAMQAGIIEANERLADRVADVSMGLVQALSTKPGHVKRRSDMIVRAIEASTVRGSKWAAGAIAKEQPDARSD
jgi:hypothetical protein